AELLRAVVLHQALGEGALPGARRPRKADAAGAASPHTRVRVGEHLLAAVAAVLDEADGAGQRRGIAAVEGFQERAGRHGFVQVMQGPERMTAARLTARPPGDRARRP